MLYKVLMLICHNVFSHHKSIFCRRDVHAGQDVAGAEAKHRGVSQTSSEKSDRVCTPPQSKSKSLKLPPIITSSSQVSTEIVMIMKLLTMSPVAGYTFI